MQNFIEIRRYWGGGGGGGGGEFIQVLSLLTPSPKINLAAQVKVRFSSVMARSIFQACRERFTISTVEVRIW